MVANDLAKGLAASFMDGLQLSLRAMKHLVGDATVYAVHKETLFRLLLLSIGVYVCVTTATFPLQLGLRMLHVVKDTAEWRTAVSRWGSTAFFLVPVAVAFIIRSIFYRPLDRVYFAVLKGLNPKLSAELEKLPRKPIREVLWTEARRLVSMMLYLPVLALLSLIPGIGMILKFLWSAYSLGRWFDPAMATALAVLSVFPLTSYPVGVGIQVFLGQMYILLECSQPYLSRQRLSRREEMAAITKRRVKAFGFILPFSILLTLPFLGPFFWISAHAAAPYALTELILVDEKKDDGATASTGMARKAE